MCERLLLAFMWVAAVVRVLVPCSISCSTYMENRFLYLSLLSLHLSAASESLLGFCCLLQCNMLAGQCRKFWIIEGSLSQRGSEATLYPCFSVPVPHFHTGLFVIPPRRSLCAVPL